MSATASSASCIETCFTRRRASKKHLNGSKKVTWPFQRADDSIRVKVLVHRCWFGHQQSLDARPTGTGKGDRFSAFLT